MRFQIGLCLAVALLPLSSAQALNRVLTFDTAPAYELPLDGLQTPLQAGEWGVEEDGLGNDVGGSSPVPIWNSGGWIQPIGFETSTAHRGPIGSNPIGVNQNAILAELGTGVVVYDDTSWGNVSTATHVTMDLKGSFAGSGGVTILLAHDGDITPTPSTPSDIPYWSWAAGASDVAVGLNPGDVTEWTTILIPINKPKPDGSSPNGEDGTWGTFGQIFSDKKWNTMLSDVNFIQVFGLTPDTQIDNLGFVLPDTGPGDFDGDTDVDGTDFLEWQRDQTGRDLTDWQNNYSNGSTSAGLVAAVPEPSSVALALGGLLSLLGVRRARS